MIFAALLLCCCASLASAQASEPWPLWPAGAPGSPQNAPPEKVRISPQGDHVISGISQPSITPYLPAADSATGTAVIIAPGGGHSELWIDHEGYRVELFLQQHGVAACVPEVQTGEGAGLNLYS